MLPKDGASLASLFNPGTTGAVADLIKEMDLPGPLETLRRSRSSVKTRCKLRRCFASTGRFVAAPGRDSKFDMLAAVWSFGLEGEATTGPPSLRLIVAHRSGSRAAKLFCVSADFLQLITHSQWQNDFNAKVPEHIVGIS